ncbi:hypothetical protein [Streptomyces cyslabdanicus]|uniref:hypothetical protein n=1 Tax=Streptomyces cyslabdanicus TaxID=1470456 RepID=UPI00404450DF
MLHAAHVRLHAGQQPDPLAELLVRHGRINELRAYAADEDWPEAVRHLAELLETRGDVAGAGEVYQRRKRGGVMSDDLRRGRRSATWRATASTPGRACRSRERAEAWREPASSIGVDVPFPVSCVNDCA